MKNLRLRDRLASVGVILLLAAALVGMSAAFPEYPEAAAKTTYGKYRTPSGFPDEMSAMPCCNIKIQEAGNEPETEKETEKSEDREIHKEISAVSAADVSDHVSQGTDDSADQTEAETVDADGFRIYRIAGELPDPDLQRKIYDALEAENIAYWYEGSLAQCFQESHFQKFAVNQRNGKDSGLFQYRSTFWDWSQGDIFDENLQIRKYAAEMAARFNAGLTADEAISRHKTSDYCTEIDWNYVRQVRQWLDQMEIVQ